MDDSYNANPLSMEMAFGSLKQIPASHHYLVLGDMGELGGPLSRHLALGAKEGGMTSVFSYDTCEEAAEKLAALAKAGDAVLVKGSHYMHMEKVPMLLRGVLTKDGK